MAPANGWCAVDPGTGSIILSLGIIGAILAGLSVGALITRVLMTVGNYRPGFWKTFGVALLGLVLFIPLEQFIKPLIAPVVGSEISNILNFLLLFVVAAIYQRLLAPSDGKRASYLKAFISAFVVAMCMLFSIFIMATLVAVNNP